MALLAVQVEQNWVFALHHADKMPDSHNHYRLEFYHIQRNHRGSSASSASIPAVLMYRCVLTCLLYYNMYYVKQGMEVVLFHGSPSFQILVANCKFEQDSELCFL